MRFRFPAVLTLLAILMVVPIVASAALDTPTVSLVQRGHAKLVLDVTAGPSGAPDGFAMYWMTRQDFEDYGAVWPDLITYPGLNWANFTGVPTLNTFGQFTTFKLGPNQTIRVELGDLEGETGLSTNNKEEMTSDVDYVVCAFAIGGTSGSRSDYSLNAAGTPTTQGQNCTYTQGYWKTHPSAWPVLSLTLGSVTYTQAQLLAILGQPTGGNGLVSLAKQLIAAKLNIQNGADGSVIAGAIVAADAIIGGLVVPPVGGGFLNPSSTSALTQALDDWNNGITGPGHCGDTPARLSTWGRVKSIYR
jgi:hypothetical protein